MTISFTPRAEADLQAVFDHIAGEDKHAASRVIARILQAIQMLEIFSRISVAMVAWQERVSSTSSGYATSLCIAK